MANPVTDAPDQKSAPNYGDMTMPIAVVGMGCRLPGDATNPEKLWEMLVQQRDVWTTVPSDRFDNELYYHPDPSRIGTFNAAGGHFLQEHPGYFDAPFFNMTQAEAVALDPQQRILLECAYETIENAGIPVEKLVGSSTAVFVGSSSRDFADIMAKDEDRVELYQSTGTGHGMLSNRISYFFDLKGPSLTVDTACSSSLVALHLACNSIRNGECTQALVGGSNLILEPVPQIGLSMLRFLSPDGRCYSYEERANGFGRGEGASCLLLKRLDEALLAGDTIRAVIRNSGTNQDGKTAGISFPSEQAQADLIESLYQAAGLDPSATTYVEAHGTGTAAGDPVEASSLSTVFSPRRNPEKPLLVGSVKSNIGHLEGGSGVTGLLKTILMLEKGYIVPNRDFRKANPRIPMDEWKMQVPTLVQPWDHQNVRRASLNNFGFGGSNAHVIVEDAPSYLASRGLEGNFRSNEIPPKTNGVSSDTRDAARLFLLSATDEASGARQVKALSGYLATKEPSLNILDDLAFTLGERRTVHQWRAAIHARSLEQLKHDLDGPPVKFMKAPKSNKVGFVFTGQGAQWCGMGRELTDAYPVYRESLLRSEAMLKALGASWSLLDELAKNDPSRLGAAFLSQPLCTAVQIALVDLLKSWNITPSSVTGHSSGEIAAAYAAGILTHDGAIAVAFYRGVAVMGLKDLPNPRAGAMAAVGLSRDETQGYINNINSATMNIACINSPNSVTVSGDEAAINDLLAILRDRGVFARKLAVDVAYHSHHMNSALDKYLSALQTLQIMDSVSVEFYSSVYGTIIEPMRLNAHYWGTNMVSPVEFCDSLLHLVRGVGSTRQKRRDRAAVDILLEIGPHSALAGPIKQILKTDTKLSSVQYLSALIRNTDAVDTSLQLASRLLQAGVPVDLRAINCPLGHKRGRLLVDMPPYSWNHSNIYLPKAIFSSVEPHTSVPKSDFLGIAVGNPDSPEARWRNIIRTSEIPWIQDHKVQSNTVCPATFYLVMAIEAEFQRASKRGFDIDGYNLREISIGNALVIPQDTGEMEVVISLKPYNESSQAVSDVWDEFCVSSSPNGISWTTHCRGLVSVKKNAKPSEVDGGRDEIEEREEYATMVKRYNDECTETLDIKNVYKILKESGLNFGPTFTNLKNARTRNDKCVATVSVPYTAETMPERYEYPFILHPAALDGFLHPLLPVFFNQSPNMGTAVPTFIREMFVSQHIVNSPGHQFDVYAKMDKLDLGNITNQGLQGSRSSLTVFDKGSNDLQPTVKIKGLQFTSIYQGSGADENTMKLAHQIKWRPDPDLMSENEIVKLTEASRRQSNIDNELEMANQAAFYFAEQALNEVPAAEVPSMAPHHQRLYSTLTEMCRSVNEGRIGIFDTSAWTSANKEERKARCDSIRSTYHEMVCQIGENLPRIFRQQIDPLTLMMEDDRLEKYYRMNQAFAQSCDQAASYVDLLGNKNPFLNILEIGAGTGGATLPLLQALDGRDGAAPRFANYDATDISTGYFEKVMEKTKAFGKLVSFKKLDIEQDPVEQGFVPASYDLIVAANVLHATSNLENTMNRVRNLLKPGGTLILIEMTVKNLNVSFIFGTLPGWWIGEEETRRDSPLITKNAWDSLLKKTNFTGVKADLWDYPGVESHYCSAIISTAPLEPASSFPEVIIITESASSIPCAHQLEKLLGSIGVATRLASITEHDLDNKLCIILASRTSCILRNPSSTQYESIKRILLKSAGVLWVTYGAQIESVAPDLSLVTGLARTIRSEKGDTMIVTLDLDADRVLSGPTEAEAIFTVFKSSFRTDISMSDIDTEYAEREGVIMIPRMIEDHTLTSFVMAGTGNPITRDEAYHQEGRHLRAEIKTPGFLDSLQFVDDPRISGDIAPDLVQVEVKATGLNFKDVMSASGQIEQCPLGLECAGVITNIGEAVQGFQAGDHVMANVRGGSVSNTIRATTNEIEHIPEDLPFDVAASLSVVYFTAYYAVFKTARLMKGETILVHAASGGLGQAIINLALIVGAEIYATVGTLEKKQLLMTEFNIREDHIFSSRDGTFATGIMRRTGSKGVDVIMNSLSGDALRLTWDCIAPSGRFVELGRRDMTVNSRLEMRRFEKNVTFTGLDLPLYTNPGEKRRIWTELMAWYTEGRIRAPRPITTFSIAETEKALRTMQGGRHIGKLVLAPRPGEIVSVVGHDKTRGKFLRGDDASYLLVGGLGGIGRAIALYMIEHGARNLIFASRSGAASEKARDCVAELKARGAHVAVFACDVSKSAEVDLMFEECAQTMPPIRGVIQAAMVIKSDLFENMTLEDYNSSLRPKVDGTWNLHNRLPRSGVDFFIMLSSAVGVFGNPSQAGYAAASLFLDAFASFRNQMGLPAVSIDLGLITGVGYVAENVATSSVVSNLWTRAIDEAELMTLIASAMVAPGRIGASITGLRPWAPAAGSAADAPIFSHFRRAATRRDDAGAESGLAPCERAVLQEAKSLDEAAQYVLARVMGKLAVLLMLPVADISASGSMTGYGLDSLVAVEMRNWLVREMDATIPLLDLLANVSLQDLSMKIVHRSKSVNPALVAGTEAS